MASETHIPIESDIDLVTARAQARALAQQLGFSPTDATLIATAISEIARNIVTHVGHGELVLRAIDEEERCGLTIVANDDGPGILDVEASLEQGYASRA